MKVKTFIKQLNKLPPNSDIYINSFLEITPPAIEKSRAYLCDNKKMNIKFWEAEWAHKKGTKKNQLDVIREKDCYLIY